MNITDYSLELRSLALRPSVYAYKKIIGKQLKTVYEKLIIHRGGQDTRVRGQLDRCPGSLNGL